MLTLRKILSYGCYAAVASSAPPTIRRGEGIDTDDDRIIASSSSTEDAHYNAINDVENYELNRSSFLPTSSSTSDVYIDCQPDTIIIRKLAEDTRDIVRHCTVDTFGPIHEPILLTCDVAPSSFTDIVCEMNPEYLTVGDDIATSNGVAAVIHIASGSSRGNVVRGEISVVATHGLDVRVAIIPVIMAGDEHVNLFESDLNEYETTSFVGSHVNVIADGQSVDYFSFAGQSNSVGHTTSGQSISKNGTHWASLMRLFNESEYIGTSQTWNQRLYDTIQSVHTIDTGPPSVITLLRDEAVRLQGLGLLNGLNRSLSFGSCSFLELQNSSGVATYIDRSGGSKSSIWSANCGRSFGHELIFSKTIEMNGTDGNFETVKIAIGGSRMYEGWYPDRGLYWNMLRDSIRNRKGTGKNWRGFFWAQGEQGMAAMRHLAHDELFHFILIYNKEALGTADPYLTYLGNLTHLVARVRSEMFLASVTGTWRCPEEIPAIISKLGFWPNRHNAQRIRDAQQAFCDSDLRSACVTMNDTSRFYHYDPISFLIGGNRMANAYLRLKSTQMSFICPPTAAPTTAPSTFKPTSNPTSPGPTSKPTSRPTSSKPTTHRPTFKPTRRPTSSKPKSPR